MVSGFCHFGLVYLWFCDRTLTLPSCLVSCERAASSVLKPCALSSACFVSCWSVVFGSWHSSCSGSVLVLCRGSDTHAPCSVLLWERAVSSSLGPCAPLSTGVVFCSACFSGSAACFFVILLCCTQLVFRLCAFSCLSCFVWLMSVVISYVSVSCFAHG